MIARIGVKKCTINRDNLAGDNAQKAHDLHKDMEDSIVRATPQSLLELREGRLRWDIGIIVNPCPRSIVSSFFRVSEDRDEGGHIRKLIEITEEFTQKKACRVICMASLRGVDRGTDSPYEGEINAGCNKSRESSDDIPGWCDLNESLLVDIVGKESVLRLGEGLAIFNVDSDIDTVKSFNNLSYRKREEVLQVNLRYLGGKRFSILSMVTL